MNLVARLILSVSASVIVCVAPAAATERGSPAGEIVVVAEKGRQPRVAVDNAGNVYVVYGHENSIFLSVSKDGGRTYARPTKVGELDELMLGFRSGPQIAVTGRHISVGAISARDGDLVVWHSADSGATWAAPVKVNDRDSAAHEGLHCLSAGLDADVFAIWIDLRDKGAKLFGARSSDGGRTWSKNFLIYQSPDKTICECCQPSATSDAKGNLHVMWRNWLDGNRDMYLIVSKDRGGSFGPVRKLGEVSWPLNACPMDGGGLAVDDADNVMSVWRRNNRLFMAAPGAPEQFFAEGMQPVVVFGPGGWYKAWMSANFIMTAGPGKAEPVRRGQGAFPSIAAGILGKPPVIAVWEGPQGVESLRLSER